MKVTPKYPSTQSLLPAKEYNKSCSLSASACDLLLATICTIGGCIGCSLSLSYTLTYYLHSKNIDNNIVIISGIGITTFIVSCFFLGVLCRIHQMPSPYENNRVQYINTD